MPIPLDAQEEDSQVHIVRYGETLSEIAQSYGVSMAVVMAENGIRNPDALYVGQSLTIPVAEADSDVAASSAEALPEDATAPAEAENADDTLTAPGDGRSGRAALQPLLTTSLNPTYTVQAGDTIPWLALRYDLDVAALRAVNNLSEGDAIRTGQQLILPASEEDLQVTAPLLRYTVQPGDSLGLIAQAHGTTLDALMTINRIANSDLIQPGQELTIPAPTDDTPAPAVGPAQTGFYYHRVRPGETPSELAQQYNSTPQAIVRYNNLPNIETLYSGLEVRIPYGPPILERRRPPTPRSGREFVVSISRQRCWVLEGDHIEHEWKCSTGQGEWVTRTGTFFVKTKLEMAQSRAYRLDMPYWLGIYDVGAYENGIHGLPIEWSTGEKLWDNLIGQPATFGCAMLMDEDAKTLFDLAYIGMPVHIVD
jgi:LysM repeat protein